MKEPNYKEEITLFGKTYKYLGNDHDTVQLENKKTGEIHDWEFWEFVEGRQAN